MNPRRIGTSLIEIMIVMAIIAVLAGIVLAVLAPVQSKARETVCLSNLRQIGLAVSTYRTDYDGIDPEIGKGVQYWQAGLPNIRQLPSFVGKYVKDRRVLFCTEYHDATPIQERMMTYTWTPAPDRHYPRGFRFSEVTARRGMNTVVMSCEHHNPPWVHPVPKDAIKSVLVLRLNNRVQSLKFPFRVKFKDW